jgi:hypothetical protein
MTRTRTEPSIFQIHVRRFTLRENFLVSLLTALDDKTYTIEFGDTSEHKLTASVV